jgi:hypothetical protein
MSQREASGPSDLHGWTPIAFQADEASVEWADLRGHRFDRPFFSRTLAHWEAESPRQVIRTDLSALAALDGQPSLDPDLIIAHPSRCGSSLLARLAAAADEGSILVSEPEILASLLNQNLAAGFGVPIERIVRQVVRGLGRIRFGTERRYVLKLPSNMTRYLPVFRRAFPNVPLVWLQRKPAEILESNLHNPAKAPVPLSPDEMVNWIARRVTLAFMAATTFVDDEVHVLDYRDLAKDPLSSIASLMRIELGAEDIARMQAVAQLHGHDNSPYVPREKQPLPEPLAAIARETLDPMYRALGARGRRR